MFKLLKNITLGKDNIAPSSTETEQDLPAIKAVQSTSGTPTGAPPYIITDTTGYDDFCSTGELTGSAYIIAWITKIKNWHYSKFEWTGLPQGVEKKHIENFLFAFGAVVLLQVEGQYIVQPFTTITPDIYGEPLDIETFSPYTIKKYKRKVGVDCAIIKYDASSVVWNNSVNPSASSGVVNGVLYKVWRLLKRLDKSYIWIENNGDITNPKVVVDEPDQDSVTAEHFENVLRSTSAVVSADKFSLGSVNAMKGSASSDPILKIENDQQDLWSDNSHWIDLLMTLLNINHNPFTEKKERQSQMEVGQNDHWNAAPLSVELETRKEGVDSIKKVFPNVNINVEWTALFESLFKEPEPLGGNEGEGEGKGDDEDGTR